MPLFINSTASSGVPPAIVADDGSYLVAPTNSTLTANTVYLRAFVLSATTTITAASFRMGATIGGKTNMGIYTLSGTLVSGSDTGQITNVASADNTFTYGTPITLTPGSYFIALSPSNSTDTYVSRAITAASKNSSYRQATNTLSGSALPSTTGTLGTTAVAPVCALYVQGGL